MSDRGGGFVDMIPAALAASALGDPQGRHGHRRPDVMGMLRCRSAANGQIAFDGAWRISAAAIRPPSASAASPKSQVLTMRASVTDSVGSIAAPGRASVPIGSASRSRRTACRAPPSTPPPARRNSRRSHHASTATSRRRRRTTAARFAPAPDPAPSPRPARKNTSRSTAR